MSNLTCNDAEFNLQQVLLLMNLLTKWLVHSGVGYMDFTAALKPIFYQQAVNELIENNRKLTVSSISLMSGLHRKDVTAYKDIMEQGKPLCDAKVSEPMSVPARVVGLWLAESYPTVIAFSDAEKMSFELLVKKISTERHPRAVLNELLRLGIVEENNDLISLKKGSYIPDTMQDSIQLLTMHLQQHMQAGLHNIFSSANTTYLEEAVRVDEITEESVAVLKEFSLHFWAEYSQKLMELALQRTALDQGKTDATHEFYFGAYQHDTK